MRRVSRRTLWIVMIAAAGTFLAAGPAMAQEGEAEGGHSKNAFQMFFTSEDIFGQIIIIALGIASVAVVSMSIQAYMNNRRKLVMPEEDLAEYAAMADDKQYAAMIN